MKSMFRNLGFIDNLLLFAVSISHAVCHISAFKLEKGKKEKNIDQNLALASASRRNSAPASANGRAR